MDIYGNPIAVNKDMVDSQIDAKLEEEDYYKRDGTKSLLGTMLGNSNSITNTLNVSANGTVTGVLGVVSGGNVSAINDVIANGRVLSRVTFQNCACAAFRSSGKAYNFSPNPPPIWLSFNQTGHGITCANLFTPIGCTVNTSTGVITITSPIPQNYEVTAQGVMSADIDTLVQMFFTKTTNTGVIPTSGSIQKKVYVADELTDFHVTTYYSLALNDTVSFAITVVDTNVFTIQNLAIQLRPVNF